MTQPGGQRRLAAIFAADMVGYSRLMEADERGTLARQKACKADIIDPTISDHNGRIVKLMGDGMLVEFASAVDAVACAVEIQRAMRAREPNETEDRRIQYRIGVNVGDIIHEGDDIFGDGVNVAARLEALAEPGEIVISATAHDHLQGKLDATFEDIGDQQVKSISRPIRAWRWRAKSVGFQQNTPLALPDKPSIAVLPFDNMSDDPEQEYFADGVAEDVITALSRFGSLFVIARNSSFAYKGQTTDIRTVSTDLGVRYVLEGSVRKAGSRVRVTAQLIDGLSGNHLWADRYDRKLDDIFEVQDEITEAITGAIGPALGKAEWSRTRNKAAENYNAWDLYLQGMHHLHLQTKSNVAEALRLFDDALALDPTMVAALSAKVTAKFRQIADLHSATIDSLRDEAIQLGLAAVQLDNLDSTAQHALGRAYIIARKHDLAIPRLRSAIELNLNFALAHYSLGHALATNGSPAEAIPCIEKAIRLSPYDPYMRQFLTHIGAAHFFLHNYDQAIVWAKKALAQPQYNWAASTVLISALGHLERLNDAQDAIAEMIAKEPQASVESAAAIWPIGDAESLRHMIDGLRKAGLPE